VGRALDAPWASAPSTIVYMYDNSRDYLQVPRSGAVFLNNDRAPVALAGTLFTTSKYPRFPSPDPVAEVTRKATTPASSIARNKLASHIQTSRGHRDCVSEKSRSTPA